LLGPAKEKFLHILSLNPNSIGPIFEYLSKNKRLLTESVLNENTTIVENNSEILFELIKRAYLADPQGFNAAVKKNQDAKPIYNHMITVLESLIGIFPKVPSKYVNKISSLLGMFNKLSKLGNEILEFLVSKEVVFLFITYLLGKESPLYNETFQKQSEAWDIGRSYLSGQENFIEMIVNIYSKIENGENKVLLLTNTIVELPTF